MKKPPVHQDGGCSMPMEILFSEISLAAHRSKTLVFDQGTLPLHWQVARLLFGVVPDVEQIIPNPLAAPSKIVVWIFLRSTVGCSAWLGRCNWFSTLPTKLVRQPHQEIAGVALVPTSAPQPEQNRESVSKFAPQEKHRPSSKRMRVTAPIGEKLSLHHVNRSGENARPPVEHQFSSLQ